MHSHSSKSQTTKAAVNRDQQTQVVHTLLYQAFSSAVVHGKYQNIAISHTQ